jgi:hypothetical protein
MRVDTTVVETNIHYPTNSPLLADGARVLTPHDEAAWPAAAENAGRVRDRWRSVARRVFQIVHHSRAAGVRTSPKARAQRQASGQVALPRGHGHRPRGAPAGRRVADRLPG